MLRCAYNNNDLLLVLGRVQGILKQKRTHTVALRCLNVTDELSPVITLETAEC